MVLLIVVLPTNNAAMRPTMSTNFVDIAVKVEPIAESESPNFVDVLILTLRYVH